MCAVEDAEPWDFYNETAPRAAKEHRCGECGRVITRGETHRLGKGLHDGLWSTFRWCEHCHATGFWMYEVCSGYLLDNLLDEMVEHWHEGYRSIAFARLIAGMRHGWNDGRDPVPDGDAVRALAGQMMAAAVAS
jgi:hypothetical protein